MRVMKNLLVGNGINIQFGGTAYLNFFIIERIKQRALLDEYDKMFGNMITGKEINDILKDFVEIANDIREHKYDNYVDDADKDLHDALKDFKNRYNFEIVEPSEIMLEDWIFLLEMFFARNYDLRDKKISAIQGFERLMLDAIYNNGKIQYLYKNVPKKTKKFFKDFDFLFTLNYDNNLENITGRKVYHLHGNFLELADSENPNIVQGYIRNKKKSTVVIDGFRHCFCNALLNYSGKLKYRVAKESHQYNIESDNWNERMLSDTYFKHKINQLKHLYPIKYEQFMVKINNPDLKIASEYYFDKFENIKDELYIIGMSPNNDGHIFDLILKNKSLKKVYFYYFKEEERLYIEKNFPDELFKCIKVEDLWRDLGFKYKKYNCSYTIPKNVDDFIKIANNISTYTITKSQFINDIKQIPKFEMDRLCTLVRDDLLKRNNSNNTITEKEFSKYWTSINYIALQEGIKPAMLYMICFMNFNKY